jgi:hypothetical protein
METVEIGFGDFFEIACSEALLSDVYEELKRKSNEVKAKETMETEFCDSFECGWSDGLLWDVSEEMSRKKRGAKK